MNLIFWPKKILNLTIQKKRSNKSCDYLQFVNSLCLNNINSFYFSQEGHETGKRKISFELKAKKLQFYSIELASESAFYQKRAHKLSLKWETPHETGEINHLPCNSELVKNFNCLIESLVESFCDKYFKKMQEGHLFGALNPKNWQNKIKEEEHAENWLMESHQMLLEALSLATLPDQKPLALNFAMGEWSEEGVIKSKLTYSLFNLEFDYSFLPHELQVKVYNQYLNNKRAQTPTLNISFRLRPLELFSPLQDLIHQIKKAQKWPMRPISAVLPL